MIAGWVEPTHEKWFGWKTKTIWGGMDSHFIYFFGLKWCDNVIYFYMVWIGCGVDFPALFFLNVGQRRSPLRPTKNVPSPSTPIFYLTMVMTSKQVHRGHIKKIEFRFEGTPADSIQMKSVNTRSHHVLFS